CGGGYESDLLFFFQAEDGIRDRNVTGVQTCALTILWGLGYSWKLRSSGRLLGWFFQWLGAGDIKFLWAAFFWLPQGKVVLMWIYTTAFCWVHHGWQQRRLLPRGDRKSVVEGTV